MTLNQEILDGFNKRIAVHPNLPIVEELQSTNEHLEGIHENLEKMANKEMPEMEMEHRLVFPDGISVVTLKGDKGDVGERGENGDNGKDGKNGRDGKDGKDGKDGVSPDLDTIAYEASKKVEEKITPLLPKKEDILDEVEKDLPKLGEGIRNALELLNGDERLDKSAIKGLEDELKRIERAASTRVSMPARRVYQPMLDRFTAQTDGSTRIFYLTREPIDTSTMEVFGTDFPIILDPTVDFTVAGKTLTLSSSFPAPSSGSTLIAKYYV